MIQVQGSNASDKEYERYLDNINEFNDTCTCGVPLMEGDNIADNLFQCIGCGKIVAINEGDE
jgi:hypothetical protein